MQQRTDEWRLRGEIGDLRLAVADSAQAVSIVVMIFMTFLLWLHTRRWPENRH